MKNTIKLIQEEIILKEELFEDLTEGWKEEELVMGAARHSKEKQVSVHKHL